MSSSRCCRPATHVLSVYDRHRAGRRARRPVDRLLDHRRGHARARPMPSRQSTGCCRSTRRCRAAPAAPTAGTLTFMVGGDEGRFRQGRSRPRADGPDASSIAATHGAGQAAKICNNMILGISMIGVAEAFVLAEKLGLSHQALFDVASTSSGQCWSLTSYCPVPGPVPASPANNGYKPGFAAALMLKDLKLAQEAAQAAGRVDADGRGGRAALRAVQRAGQRRRRFLRHHQLPARPCLAPHFLCDKFAKSRKTRQI